MARLLWCRLCGDRYLSIAGVLAPTCPSCERPAKWSTTPNQTIKPQKYASKRPRVLFDLNLNDQRFLRRLRHRYGIVTDFCALLGVPTVGVTFATIR